MNNQATQLPTPQPADCGAPPLPKGAKKRYRAARIAPAILCIALPFAFSPLTAVNFGTVVLSMLVFSIPLFIVPAFVFCFARVAKWRVSRKHHIAYPIAIFCALEFAFFLVLAVILVEPRPSYGVLSPDERIFGYISLVIGLLIAGAQAICFVVQYLLGKKYPQILEEESIELKKMEEKYYFGGDSHVEM